MRTYPYLRAYLAGVFLPTLILPLLLGVFIVARVVMELPVPIEQGMIFPMAVVPLLWGLWNMGWLWLHGRSSMQIGLHGAILPLVLAPLGGETAHALGVLQFGATGATWFHMVTAPYAAIVPCFLAALAGYYLVWKYLVGFLNRVLGIG
jgi:hypothetical protein